jgi:hypothetical protein
MLSTPNMARGVSGSSTRTMSRNIMPLKAMEVPTIRQRSSSMASGWKMTPSPAMSEPMTVRQMPDRIAFIAPAMFRPITSSSLVMGVTRYPSCTPRALSSM